MAEFRVERNWRSWPHESMAMFISSIVGQALGSRSWGHRSPFLQMGKLRLAGTRNFVELHQRLPCVCVVRI